MSYITIPLNIIYNIITLRLYYNPTKYYLQYYNSQLYYNPTKYYLQYYNSQASYITIPD